MAVILKSPWRGHEPGARLALPAYDERALVRAGAAAWVREGPAVPETPDDPPVRTPVKRAPVRKGRKG